MSATHETKAAAAPKFDLRARLSRVRDWVKASPFRALACLLLPLAAAPRLAQMFFDQGVFWPDEIFQTMEQAHRFAFGYGWTPWEFRDGARSWVFPGILGVLLKVASWLQLTKSGVGVVMVTRTLMLALALLGVHATMRLGQRIGGTLGAFVAGTLAALFPPLLVYGTRCMTEMASGPLLVVAALWTMDKTWKRAALAGALASLLIYFRYQNGVLAVGFLLYLLVNRCWKPALAYAATATVVGLAGGMLDWVVWGKPFAAFLAYIKFNLIEGQAARWGVSSLDYYHQTALSSVGVVGCVVVATGFFASLRWMRVFPLVILIYIGAHAAIPHKEFRFLMPIVPLMLGLAGGGWGWLLGGRERDGVAAAGKTSRFTERFGGWIATGLGVLVGSLFALRTPGLTFAAMGQFATGKEDGWTVWNHEAGPNFAFWEAGKHDDICGISTWGIPLVSLGGYSYLHKNVPMLGGLSHSDLASANYIAIPRLMPPPPGYSLVKSFSFDIKVGPRTDGQPSHVPNFDYALFRRDGGCRPPPPWWTPNFV